MRTAMKAPIAIDICVRSKAWNLAQVVVAIRFDQAFEQLNFAAEFSTAFGIGHTPGTVPGADDGHAGNYVHAVADGSFHGLEVMMLGEKRAVGFEHKRVAVILSLIHI